MSDNNLQQKEFTLSRAKAAVLSRDFNLAARLYTGLLRDDPDNLQILHELANMYVRSGQDERALDVYESILSKKENDLEALTDMGGIYRRLNRYEDSVKVLDQALKYDPYNVQVHYNLGFTYKLMGMYQDALDCFTTVINSNPSDILAYNQLGTINSLLGKTNDAINSYRKGLQLDPNHPVLHFNLAKELEKMGRDKDAKTEYEAALRAKPGWSDAVNGYALFLMAHNKYAEAYDLLQRGIKVSPKDIMLQDSMGELQYLRGDYADAETRYKKILEQDSENQSAIIGLANVYSKEEKTEQADNLLNSIRKKPPQTEDAKIRYAKALLNAKHITEGGKIIKRLWDSDRSNENVQGLVAQYYAIRNDTPRLKTLLDKISAADSNYRKHFLDIAERFRQNGNTEEAELYLQQYLDYSPDDSVAMTVLASCYELLKKYDQALAMYRKALARDRSNQILQLAVKRADKYVVNKTSLEEKEVPLDQEIMEDSLDIPSEDETIDESVGEDFSNDDSSLIETPSLEKELQDSGDEDEIIFNLDNVADNFTDDDIYDPLELEPMDLEPIEEEEPSLEALTLDGTPVDYEPIAKDVPIGEADSLDDLSFEDEELDFSSDIETESTSIPMAEEPKEPYIPPKPQYQPPQMPQMPPIQMQMPPMQMMPPIQMQMPQMPAMQNPQPAPKFEAEVAKTDIQELPAMVEPEVTLAKSEPEGFVLSEEALEKIPEVFNQLVDNETAEQCDSAASLFRHMRQMCDYLPPVQKEAFMVGQKRVQMEYIIHRLTGRPGLLASAEALRNKGLVEVPEELYDVVEKFDVAAVASKVFGFMRNLIHQLPDEDAAYALDSSVTNILERLGTMGFKS